MKPYFETIFHHLKCETNLDSYWQSTLRLWSFLPSSQKWICLSKLPSYFSFKTPSKSDFATLKFVFCHQLAKSHLSSSRFGQQQSSWMARRILTLAFPVTWHLKLNLIGLHQTHSDPLIMLIFQSFSTC